jgi:hypothetical protein
VQLPFLQTVLGDFSLVPFAVGDATGAEVSEVVDLLWGGDETLIVVSSDLSHYHRYAEARRLDQATGQAILDFSAHLDTTRPAERRPSTAFSSPRAARGSPSSSSTCATRATPRATGTASSATLRSLSSSLGQRAR